MVKVTQSGVTDIIGNMIYATQSTSKENKASVQDLW